MNRLPEARSAHNMQGTLETYLSLRKLENRVLEDIYGGQMVMGDFEPIQVSLDQFYGIEANDFAVEVAKTAL